MKNEQEIIEMEILGGIDRLFHTIMCSDRPPDMQYKRLLSFSSDLKEKIPKYIDEMVSVIGADRKHLLKSFENSDLKE